MGSPSETVVGLRRRTFESKTGDVRSRPLRLALLARFNSIMSVWIGRYDFLLCLGICPHDVVFNMWRKGAVAEGRAGRLVRMAEGQAVTYKLTKKLDDMRGIASLPADVRTALSQRQM